MIHIEEEKEILSFFFIHILSCKQSFALLHMAKEEKTPSLSNQTPYPLKVVWSGNSLIQYHLTFKRSILQHLPHNNDRSLKSVKLGCERVQFVPAPGLVHHVHIKKGQKSVIRQRDQLGSLCLFPVLPSHGAPDCQVSLF